MPASIPANVSSDIRPEIASAMSAILSGAHQTLLPKMRQRLDESGASDIRIIAGGIIPQEDIPELQANGVAQVFLSGTSIAEIVDYLMRESASA